MFGFVVAASLCLAAQEKSEGGAQPKWEYCELDGGDASLENGIATGTAIIRFAVDDGWRWEEVRVTRVVPASRKMAGNEGEEAKAKAMAQLGKRGWEMVAVTLDSLTDRRRWTYHFKRRAD